MKQVLFCQGKVKIESVPAPVVQSGQVLVEVTHSFISTGTEIGWLKSESGNFWVRALKQPQAIYSALKMVQSQGLKKTWMMVESIRNKENSAGYSCAGRVLEVGAGITDIFPGDRVACGGSAYAHHAELVSVPRNLVVRVPDGLSLENACSATVGSIALQGVRQADVRLGDRVAVIGLGLLGQITVQLLKVAGCHILGTDLDSARRKKAQELGASLVINPTEENLMKSALGFSNGQGVDVSIITAASSSSGIIQQAMEITRRKGKVVLVGSVPIQFDRAPFYQKEIDFLISCSYGPGRYDKNYEEKGIDYPYPYVRWTENRNMQEFLELCASGQVDISKIVDSVFPSEKVMEAYETLANSKDKPLGVILCFPAGDKEEGAHKSTTQIKQHLELPVKQPLKEGTVKFAIIGAGGFAQVMHLPNAFELKDIISLKMIVDLDGVNARNVARQYNVPIATCDANEAFNDTEVDAVLISTRHNVHSELTIKALKAGKSVLCEKPMGLTPEEIESVGKAVLESGKVYLTGFNRRFSPSAEKIKSKIKNRRTPLLALCRIASGYQPLDSWTQGEEGGGRIIGECCHWIDLMQYFVGDEVEVSEIDVSAIRPKERGVWWGRDNLTVTLRYADGSIGTLIYCSMASTSLPKEYIEVHWDGNSAIINDFKELNYYPAGKSKQTLLKSPKIDKGHLSELRLFTLSVKGQNPPPISLESLCRTSRLSCHIDYMVRADFQETNEKTGERK